MRLRIIRIALVLGILAGALVACPPHADAAVTRVYVEDHTGSAWPVNAQQNWVDQYAGSDLVYGACRTGYRCVRVWERRGLTNPSTGEYATAITYPGYWATIYVNPSSARYPAAARANVIAHEMFHAVTGNGYHSGYCTNVMYRRVFCPSGSIPAHRFTAYAIDQLRRH